MQGGVALGVRTQYRVKITLSIMKKEATGKGGLRFHLEAGSPPGAGVIGPDAIDKGHRSRRGRRSRDEYSISNAVDKDNVADNDIARATVRTEQMGGQLSKSKFMP